MYIAYVHLFPFLFHYGVIKFAFCGCGYYTCKYSYIVLILIHFTAAIASVLNRKFHVHVYYKTNYMYSDFCLHVSLHEKVYIHT